MKEQFASMRAAYDSLADQKNGLDDLVCIHDFAYSRALIDPNLLTNDNKASAACSAGNC